MNSLRVDGFSCGLLTERAWEGRSGCVKRAVAAIIWGRMSRWLVGASHVAFAIAYINPLYPIFMVHFSFPPIHRSSHLH